MSKSGKNFSCPNCKRMYNLSEKVAGKNVHCKCGSNFKAPHIIDKKQQKGAIELSIPDSQPSNQPINTSTDNSIARPVQLTNCPTCGNKISPGAVLCINCGTDFRSYKKLETKSLQNPAIARNKSKEKQRPGIGLKIAGYGLMLHGLGATLLILGIGFHEAISRFFSNATWGKNALSICAIAIIIGMLAFSFSPLLCIFSPSKSGRNYLLGAIGCFTINAILNWFFASGLIAIASLILPLAGLGLFLGFLLKIGDFLYDDSLYNRAEFLIKVLLVMIVCWVVIMLCTGGMGIIPISSIIGSLAGMFISICSLIFTISFFIFIYTYISVIFHAHNTIQRANNL